MTREEFYKKWNESYESPYIYSETDQQTTKVEFMSDLDKVISQYKDALQKIKDDVKEA